jgi:peptidoglycan/LPS O-acetylase OafA/YrhL
MVPLFFALSGFLVAGSMIRTNNLPTFITLRILRIFPAMGGEIVISALLLGPYVTVLSMHQYFTNGLFYSYFLNIFGDIHYFLPGVFLDNPAPWLVNVQLWTVPYDLECYAILAFFAYLGLVKHPAWFGITALAVNILGAGDDWFHGRMILDARSPGHFLTATFLWGFFLFLYREKVPYNFPLFCLSMLVMWPCLNDPYVEYIGALPVAYITIYVGLLNPRKIFIINGRDYSYALYLYGFPIQQAVYQLLPQYHGDLWPVHFAISMFFTSICAFLSWTYLESRIMNLKKPAIAYVNALCERMQRAANSTQLPD